MREKKGEVNGKKEQSIGIGIKVSIMSMILIGISIIFDGIKIFNNPSYAEPRTLSMYVFLSGSLLIALAIVIFIMIKMFHTINRDIDEIQKAIDSEE